MVILKKLRFCSLETSMNWTDLNDETGPDSDLIEKKVS